VRRFALYAGLALVSASAAAFYLVRNDATERAERTATAHTEYIAAAVLPDRLRRSDFAAPVSGRRRAELDELARRELLTGGVLRVKLYNRTGLVVYSTDHQLIGTRPPDVDEVMGALHGSPVGDLTTLNAEGGTGPDPRVLESYVPARLSGAGTQGVVELYTDYGPIASEARSIFLPLAGGTAVVLLALYLSFFPILRGVTRTLREQVEEIEHTAYHDDLTGLPNRALFRDRAAAALEEAKANLTRLAVLLIDLDRFKDVNDTLGHASGDRLLDALARDLPQQMRSGDTVARLGGDEFGILAQEISDPSAVLALAEKLRRILSEPREVDGIDLEVDASIGIALYPDHGDDAETLLQKADVAMYRSKEMHAPVLYDCEHDHYSPERLSLVAELHRAIVEGELTVIFQSQHAPCSGDLEGVEALLRWQHPQRGLLPPDDFVPIAEHTGLIRELTAYVLKAAVEQARRWQDEGRELSVAVNISPADLLDPSFPKDVADVLRRNELDPGRLELEITENSAITDLPRARAILAELRALGVRLAIDDFGTGNSSLAHFRHLPIDTLKIDRTFVTKMVESPEDSAIVHSTIELAHDLGIRVVAEGVEDADCNERLAQFGCDLVQGYLYGRPVPAREIGRTAAYLGSN
jgi:diguanylate cyclase (GGDEF)-like protein